MKNKNVIIAAGGSGGHIFPAFALAERLREDKSVNIIFACSRRQLDRNILEGSRYDKILFSINPMPHKVGLSCVKFLINVLFDILISLGAVIKYRPALVAGFGGYTSGAILITASLLGIKTLIHEQNLIPGRANRLLDRFVNAVAVSFRETHKYFKNRNIIFTGNPLRQGLLKGGRVESAGKLNLEAGIFTVLVMGGSQGAVSLNRLALKAICALDEDIRKSVQILHITGNKDKEQISSAYTEKSVRNRTFSFLENIADAYNVCDIAVSRAGSSAIFELAAYARPMILIPYPSKKNNQRSNAQYFRDWKAAIYHDEYECDSKTLSDTLCRLIRNKDLLKTLSDNAKRLAVLDADIKLKDEVKKML